MMKKITVTVDKSDLKNLGDSFISLSDDTIKDTLQKELTGQGSELNIVPEGSQYKIEWSVQKPDSEAESYNKKALAFARQKKMWSAVEQWEKAIESDKDPDFYYNCGLALFELKEYEKSLSFCLQATKICPIYYRAFFILGSIYSRMRKFNDALQALNKGLVFNRENVSGFVNLGAVYSVLKKYPEAINAFERATSLSSKEVRAYLGLAKIYSIQGDVENANRNYKVVMKLDPDGKLGNIAKKAIKFDPEQTPDNDEKIDEKDAANYYSQAYHSFLNGDYKNAVDCYKKYLSVKTHDADVWSSLAFCQLRLGLTEDSLKSILNAIKYSDSKAVFFKQAAIIYDASNNASEVVKMAERAYELGKK